VIGDERQSDRYRLLACDMSKKFDALLYEMLFCVGLARYWCVLAAMV